MAGAARREVEVVQQNLPRQAEHHQLVVQVLLATLTKYIFGLGCDQNYLGCDKKYLGGDKKYLCADLHLGDLAWPGAAALVVAHAAAHPHYLLVLGVLLHAVHDEPPPIRDEHEVT